MKILNAKIIRMEGAEAITSVYRLRFSPMATKDQHQLILARQALTEQHQQLHKDCTSEKSIDKHVKEPAARFRPRDVDVKKLVLVNGGRHPEHESDTDADQRCEGCVLRNVSDATLVLRSTYDHPDSSQEQHVGYDDGVFEERWLGARQRSKRASSPGLPWYTP